MKAEQVKVGMVVYDEASGEYVRITVDSGKSNGVLWVSSGEYDDGHVLHIKHARPLTRKEKGL